MNAVETIPAPPAAAAGLRRAELRAWAGAGILALGAAGIAVVGVLTSRVSVWSIASAAAAIAGFFCLTALRARTLRQHMSAGCRRALVVGWTRTPDGTNYAVFAPQADPTESDPDYVIRLALSQQTGTAEALVAGKRAAWRAAAVLSQEGQVFAVGRVRAASNGRRVWKRRHRKTPWWVRGRSLNAPPSL